MRSIFGGCGPGGVGVGHWDVLGREWDGQVGRQSLLGHSCHRRTVHHDPPFLHSETEVTSPSCPMGQAGLGSETFILP